LKGISTNINNKVIGKIYKHIVNNNKENNIHVVIGIDREGNRDTESRVDLAYLDKKLEAVSDKISSIFEIIATQDIESWFFIDIDGIYRFLKVPRKMRNKRKYNNHEGFNNRDLSKLFRQHKRVYSKGNSVEGLVESLDLNRIYDECDDLKLGIQRMLDLI